jgi:DNA modification methylase
MRTQIAKKDYPMTNKKQIQIEHLKVDDLIPYAQNARTHSDQQVAQIAASMTEFGFTNPILIAEDNTIIAGHGRLMASKMLNLATVPVIRLNHLDETQRRALVIADNKIAENAGWDEDLLRQEIHVLDDLDFDIDILGFSEDDLENILLDPNAAQGGMTDENAIPEVTETPTSVAGDIWICGDHKVLCGDSTMIDAYHNLMGEELADMVFTDPPYNVNYANSAKDKMRGTNRPIKNDNLGDEFGEFLYDVCTNLMMMCKGALYVCMSSSELHTLQRAFKDAGGKWSTFIIWAKNTFTLGRADYQRQYEPILYGWKEGHEHFWCGARDQSDVWFVNKPIKNDLHPTMKPIELVERALHNSSKTKDIVLDAFGGSGSTMIACEKTSRRARLIELDPKYVDVIVKRWQEYTGQKAIHAEKEKEFDILSQ